MTSKEGKITNKEDKITNGENKIANRKEKAIEKITSDYYTSLNIRFHFQYNIKKIIDNHIKYYDNYSNYVYYHDPIYHLYGAKAIYERFIDSVAARQYLLYIYNLTLEKCVQVLLGNKITDAVYINVLLKYLELNSIDSPLFFSLHDTAEIMRRYIITNFRFLSETYIYDDCLLLARELSNINFKDYVLTDLPSMIIEKNYTLNRK